MIYGIPSKSGCALSEALFALSRPASVRKPGEVTTAMCSVVDDTLGNSWLILDDQRQVYVNEQAELGLIEALLQPHIVSGDLPAETAAQLEALIDANRGQCLTVWTALPEFFKSQAKTWDSMIEDGLLVQPGSLT